MTPKDDSSFRPHRPPVALTIAGSDPSGGAGIQADLKTFSALGAYGTSVITALTAQATTGVTGVHAVPVDFVREQAQTLLADVRIDAVKVGMLASAELAEAVGEVLADLAEVPIVLDPVMVSTAGARLLDEDAIDAVRALLPLATVITPNLSEAAVLLGEEPASDLDEMAAQAQRLHDLGAQMVLLKGGHLAPTSGAVDLWSDGSQVVQLEAPRLATTNTHGTGCSLSSALAAFRPRHETWLETARAAKDWLTQALRHADVLEIGSGPGPVHHFFDAPRWTTRPERPRA
ncbi:bifunctional hydroxymethylpyrimidine kinase/phosphomethylpyrimidine kinase [Janibacter sp. GXQ6167]|uniref:bifunctional hydroxymethylpyrimidine kinase/phosphomethylpyrimidine kinase n=1 Tax=Janibacter sp. GXQ6167 TaxID=3240791 RepID=UPI00352572CE